MTSEGIENMDAIGSTDVGEAIADFAAEVGTPLTAWQRVVVDALFAQPDGSRGGYLARRVR